MTKRKSKLPGLSSKVSRKVAENKKNLLGGFAKTGEGGAADWGQCNAELMYEVIKQMTDAGGAVIFGLSRDGSVHHLTLMLGKKRVSLWMAADADLNEEMRNVLETLETDQA